MCCHSCHCHCHCHNHYQTYTTTSLPQITTYGQTFNTPDWSRFQNAHMDPNQAQAMSNLQGGKDPHTGR